MFLFILTALSLLAAMATAPVPLSLDGPSHTYNAGVIRHLFAGDKLYREYFYLGSPLIPNWLGSVITAAIALPGASRWSILFMNALVILLTAGSLYFVVKRSGGAPARPEQRFYVLTILMPIAVNVFVIMGFWGFLISADLCFIAVGLLQDDTLIRRRVIAPGLVLLGVWAHPVPVVLTALIPAAGYARAMFEVRGSGRDAAKRLTARFAGDILPWCVAGVFIANFAIVLTSHETKERVYLMSQIANRLIGLARPEGLSRIAATETVGALFSVYVALLGVGALAPYGLKQDRVGYAFRWQLNVFAGILLILYFIVPDSLGNGTYIARRVLWIAIAAICVLAVSGALALNVLFLRSCAICAAIITIAFSVEYLLMSRRMEPAVQELRAAMANLPRHSKTLLLTYRLTPLCDRWPILDETLPERHLALITVTPRDLIVLNDYEPGTGHFPVQYRDQRFSAIANEFDFKADEGAAWAGALDSTESGTFVISWGVPSGRSQGCESWVDAPLRDVLRNHYALRYESANQSRVQLWERRR